MTDKVEVTDEGGSVRFPNLAGLSGSSITMLAEVADAIREGAKVTIKLERDGWTDMFTPETEGSE